MISLSFILSLALVPFAFAQNNAQLQVEAIEAHFSNAGLVPSLLSTFVPEAEMVLDFTGVGSITPGQALSKTQVAPVPSVLITPANSSVKLEGSFTLAMIDADIVGTDETQGQTRHWLVNGVTLSGSSPLNASTESATTVTNYAGPGPAAGSGAHRYVVLLYTQPSTFSAPDGLKDPGAPVEKFVFSDYVKNSGLGPLVAATYFTVEEGTATVTVSSTAAVVSSTLASVSSTAGTSSGSGSASGSATPTPTGSNQNSAKSSKIFSFEVVFVALALGFLLG